MVPTVEHTARLSRELRSSWTAVKCPSLLKGRASWSYHKTSLHINMASLNQRKPIGGAGNNRVVGSVSGWAARGCGAAGSGPCGESSKCPKSFRVGTLNVATMKGKASEVVETVPRRIVDLCCLQETRWKIEGVKQIVAKDSCYKLFWSGNDNATDGVGVLLAEEWWEKVFEVVRVSDRIILIRMTIDKTVFVFVCVYAP